MQFQGEAHYLLKVNMPVAYLGCTQPFLLGTAHSRLATITTKEAIKAFEDIGVDELILWPCIPELDQVDRLAELVG